MSEWFIQHDEETEIGPLKPRELLELVRNGTVTKETMCRKDGSAMVPAGTVGGLFRAASTHVVGYGCPNCGKSVSQPPTYCKACDQYIDEATEIIRDQTGKKVGVSDFDIPKENFASWTNWVTRLKAQREQRIGGSGDHEDET